MPAMTTLAVGRGAGVRKPPGKGPAGTCEGFRMPAMTTLAVGRGAGVRKPPGKEPAGRSFVAGGALTRLATRAGGAAPPEKGRNQEPPARGGKGEGRGGGGAPVGGGG